MKCRWTWWLVMYFQNSFLFLKAKTHNWIAQNVIWKEKNFEFFESENWVWKICEFFEFFSFELNEFRIEIYRIFRTFFAFSNQSNRKFSNRIDRISNESQFDSTPNKRRQKMGRKRAYFMAYAKNIWISDREMKKEG